MNNSTASFLRRSTGQRELIRAVSRPNRYPVLSARIDESGSHRGAFCAFRELRHGAFKVPRDAHLTPSCLERSGLFSCHGESVATGAAFVALCAAGAPVVDATRDGAA
jgi:hypothetical protein